MFMSNKTVVLAIFNDEASADMAAASLKGSGVAKGDAIGVLVLDEKGKIKANKVGKRSMGKGTGIGVLAPVPEASIVASELTDLGGITEAHEVSDEALEEARTAAATDES
jgi:hypothetical protein